VRPGATPADDNQNPIGVKTMNITELLVTGYDGAAILFATTLTADGAKVIKTGTDAEGETVVGEAWEKATDAFTTVRDLMNDILSPPAAFLSDAEG
jgi:hypothetical protein